MKKLTYIVILLLFISCKKNPEQHIKHLNGYWEIISVTLPDGTKRNYKINQTIDFIFADSIKGYRKKVKPNFSGTFETSKNQEDFTLKIEDDSLNLYYTTPFSSWKETVLQATDSELTITNTSKVLYLYKRYKPIIVK